MIKVNLLESVTDRPKGAAVVEDRVANPRARNWILMASIFTLLVLGMLFDYFSAISARAKVQADLERQQQIAAQMAAIKREQADLEKKIKDTQSRIDAIKKLRASQQGPVALLSSVNERIPQLSDFRLTSITQKDGELTIEGHSPNEAAITQFGRSLEFSSGLFTNVSLEALKKDVEVNAADYDPANGPVDLTIKPETLTFVIKCRHNLNDPAQQANNAAAGNQMARK
jgi:Tfp pilus assembly protein PilN